MLANNKTFTDFAKDFTDASVKWIRPIFLKEDGNPIEMVEKLAQKPNSSARKNALIALIETNLEDNPEAVKHVDEIYDILNKRNELTGSIQISKSKNVNTGTISAGRSIIMGDGNILNDGKE
jgi:ferritin-like metal-binding protein YciE